MESKAMWLLRALYFSICFNTFRVARQLAPEPLASSPSASSSSSSLCSRPLATTLWGAAFAFFSLMADAWPASKAATSLWSERRYLRNRLAAFFLIGPVAPMIGIAVILTQMYATLRFRQILRSSTNPQLAPDTMSMSNRLRGLIDDILVILFGINQPPGFLKRTRIVANTYIVLGMSSASTLPPSHIDRHASPVNEDNMADALTLGHKTPENSHLMELNQAGKLALLETSSILPHYKQLRFLDGRSGIATFIMGVQAGGYVISTAYRATHNLPVSPIEAIGFAFSMLVILHSLVHSVGVICQNHLVIYLNPAQEQEMLDKCRSTRWLDVDDLNCGIQAMVGTFVVANAVIVFTIYISPYAIGPILFAVSIVSQLQAVMNLASNRPSSTWGVLLGLGSVMISFGGIVVSIVATILNWQTNKFDSRTPSAIHSLPFLG